MEVKTRVTIRQAKPDECEAVYTLKHDDLSWKDTDAPYFSYETPTLVAFRNDYFKTLCEGYQRRVIDVDGRIVGMVSFYWECAATRWLEVGLAIFDPDYRGKGVGKQALTQWITEVFATQTVARVGLTTWSGNTGMMRLADKLGLQCEARLRKVRYYQGEYHDSIRYGVLREEWAELTNNPRVLLGRQ